MVATRGASRSRGDHFCGAVNESYPQLFEWMAARSVRIRLRGLMRQLGWLCASVLRKRSMGTPPGQTGGVYHFWGTEIAPGANAGAPAKLSLLLARLALRGAALGGRLPGGRFLGAGGLLGRARALSHGLLGGGGLLCSAGGLLRGG